MEFLTKKYLKSPNAQSYFQLSILEYNHLQFSLYHEIIPYANAHKPARHPR